MMDYVEFKERFMKAVVSFQEQMVLCETKQVDVLAMTCVLKAGLPSTPREQLPLWVLLVATYDYKEVDYEAVRMFSYGLTFPAWKRWLYELLAIHKRLADHPNPLPELRSRD